MTKPDHIAIGRRGTKDVDLWASVQKVDPDGRIHFFVLNGLWDGSLNKGTVFVNYTKYAYDDNIIMWRGLAPFHRDDYNEAVHWIEARISRPWSMKIKDWLTDIWNLRHYRIKISIERTKAAPRTSLYKYDYNDDKEIPF